MKLANDDLITGELFEEGLRLARERKPLWPRKPHNHNVDGQFRRWLALRIEQRDTLSGT